MPTVVFPILNEFALLMALGLEFAYSISVLVSYHTV